MKYAKKQDFELYANQKTFSSFSSGPWQNAFEKIVDTLGKPVESITYLDFGCGDGKFYKFLRERGMPNQNIHGTEVSKIRVDRCQAIGWTHAKFHDSGPPLPYEPQSFDIVNMIEVIEHIPQKLAQPTIADLARILKPGGYLLITTPNYPIKRFYDFWDVLRYGKWRRLRDDPTHVTFYNHKRLKDLLSPHFSEIEELPFKNGFLYQRWPKSFFRHKMFFLCRKTS